MSGFFDRFLKGEEGGRLAGGKANTAQGDGRLGPSAPEADRPDAFTDDPLNPVPSVGGNVCCAGNAVQAESFDQKANEARDDGSCNLNTGGNNYDEATGVVARNSVHHSQQSPSSVTFTVVRGSATSSPATRR